MFSSKAFNTAFLIALSCHLICMFAVDIVVLPGRYKARDLTSVSFLGPILEKTALEIILANKPVAITTSYQRDLKYEHNIGKKETPGFKDDVKRHIDDYTEANIDRAFSRIPLKSKEVPSPAAKERRRVYLKDSDSIPGHTLNRELIYKPEKPKLPTWVDGSSPFRLVLEFIVSAEGEVKEVVPVVSSGSPEIDLLGIRYLKSWKFVPLKKGSDDEQKGSVKFIFEAE